MGKEYRYAVYGSLLGVVGEALFGIRPSDSILALVTATAPAAIGYMWGISDK